MNETKDTCNASACRQSSRGILQDQIARLRRKADALQVIADMLPANPTPQQDEALWQVLIDLPRN